MKVSIVGLGLIGGSIARDLKSQINVTVYGVDNNPDHAVQAMELGLVHEMKSLEEAIAESDVIVMAIPVNHIESILPSVLDQVDVHQTVIDVGSTKEKICAGVQSHVNRSRYVAAHPLAGTEYSGPTAAIPRLFVDKKNIICERDLSADDALEVALKIFRSMGMKTYFLNPGEHDKHLAYVSHLSHVSSFMLGLTVLDIEKDESQIFNLASTGFASTVRLAKSNPNTWAPIFEKNKEHLATALDSYINYLIKFKKAIEGNDESTSRELMQEANDIKRILN
ncbi:MAG: prephenate dehydrogenase [Saprospiraceae bacterium]|nr:prephenate dehydrogenase [Saprospiraceae bacterium]